MPMPHVIQMQVIHKRLREKEGKAKLKEIRDILDELPKWNTGPYGEIRKWLMDEINKTKTRSKIKHQDWLGVKRQGERQYVLVGCPSVGKSSLIKEISGLQTKIAEYSFTTLKPIPGVVNINGARIQIVDLPGLIEGAVDDIGGGKRLLGIVKNSDGILLMHDLTKSIDEIEVMVTELQKAGIVKPMIVIGSKSDLPSASENLVALKKRFSDNVVLGISVMTKEGLEGFKDEIWKISDLIRVFPVNEKNAVILEKGSSIECFVKNIHRDMVMRFKFARVTGKSTKFPKQQVGIHHILEDNDEIELVLQR